MKEDLLRCNIIIVVAWHKNYLKVTLPMILKQYIIEVF